MGLLPEERVLVLVRAFRVHDYLHPKDLPGFYTKWASSTLTLSFKVTFGNIRFSCCVGNPSLWVWRASIDLHTGLRLTTTKMRSLIEEVADRSTAERVNGIFLPISVACGECGETVWIPPY